MLSGLLKYRGKPVPAWLIPTFGYVLSAVCLVWVFKHTDLDALLQSIQTMHWGWVGLAVVADISVYVCQGWRWSLLLSPVVSVPLMRSVQAIYVGLFANEVLPLRPGELIRPYLQARWSEIPFSVAFSSVLIERIFDGIWLVLLLFGVVQFISLPGFLVDLATILAAVTLVVAVMLGFVMFGKQHAHAAVCGTRWSAKLQVLVEDLHLMGNSKSFYAAAGASVLYLLMQAVPVYALMKAYGFDLSVGPALVLLVIWRLGTVIPQAPGNLGSSQALMLLALSLFGIDKSAAANFSFVFWGVITLPLLLAGLVALAFTGVKFGEIHDHARSVAHAPPSPAESQSQ
jgi:uncharacterized protein (TIRG00374 family)